MTLQRTGIVLVLSATLGSASVVRADDLRIAVVVPRTGTVATAGDQVVAGATLAAKAINAAGGILGRTIVLDVEDDACDPKQAVSVAGRIVGEGITLVDGHVCSAASIAAAETYAENKILMMTPASVNAKLTDMAFAKGWPTIFRVYTRDDIQGKLVGAYMAAHFKGKRIVFLHDKGTYGKGLADQVRQNLNADGVREVFTEGINPGEKDYSAVVGKLQALGAEVVYYGGYPPEGGLIMRQAADAGLHVQLVTTSGFAAPEFWSIAGKAGEGTIFPFPPEPARRPAAKSVVEAFKAIGFVPDGFTLFSYAAIQDLAEGVRRAGSSDGLAVAKALRAGGPVETVIGPLSFDQKGDALGITYQMNVWHDGAYGPLEETP
jgi:branched-chain amino acid transport system substrate-binding protein